MRTVLETAGAQRGVLLLSGADGALAFAAEGDAAEGRYRPLPADPVGAMPGGTGDGAAGVALPRSIMAYVARTREPLVLGDAAADPRFAEDPDVRDRRPRSVLCLPLLRQAALVGVLHLENNLATDTFVAQRLEAPRLLAAQIAISLENARLYDDMAEFSRKLETQVAERTRELSEQSTLLEATLGSMSDGLVVFDADHRLRLWNERATAMFPLPGAIRLGMRYEELAHLLFDAGAMSRETPIGFEHGTEEFDLADGRIIQVRRNIMPDRGMVRVYLDVTEDRRRERELLAAHEQLKAAQASLVQAEKLASLGQLVAGVAHEINTPLGVALTSSTFLGEQTTALSALAAAGKMRRSDFDQFLADARETLTLLASNIARAADLVQSFKQVAVDQTSDERRRFDLKHRLEEIVVSLSPAWKKAGHRLELDCAAGIELESYPGVLSQIVTNLVMNSLIHAFEPGRSGAMALQVRRQGGGAVELVYSDDGRGIPAEHRSRVFDPFFTTRRGAGSTGLGLHIVFNLVTGKLGGSIELGSGEGAGTRFTLRIPLAAPAEAGQAGTAADVPLRV